MGKKIETKIEKEAFKHPSHRSFICQKYNSSCSPFSSRPPRRRPCGMLAHSPLPLPVACQCSLSSRLFSPLSHPPAAGFQARTPGRGEKPPLVRRPHDGDLVFVRPPCVPWQKRGRPRPRRQANGYAWADVENRQQGIDMASAAARPMCSSADMGWGTTR